MRYECYGCKCETSKPTAMLFSPPKEGRVTRHEFCDGCYFRILNPTEAQDAERQIERLERANHKLANAVMNGGGTLTEG